MKATDLTQTRIDFTRGDQLGLLRELCIPDAPATTANARLKGSTAKAVLQAIDGVGRQCWASIPTIAAIVGISIRTATRARLRLAELGLIVCDDRKRRNANGSVTLHVRIDWTEVDLRVRKAVAQRDMASAQRDMVSAQRDMVSAQRDTLSAQRDMVSPNTQEPANDPQPPDAGEGAVGFRFQNSKTSEAALLESVGVSPLESQRLAKSVPQETIRLRVAEFVANRSKFNGPGALVVCLREGAWPVAIADPLAVAQAARQASRLSAERLNESRRADLYKSVRAQFAAAGKFGGDYDRDAVYSEIDAEVARCIPTSTRSQS